MYSTILLDDLHGNLITYYSIPHFLLKTLFISPNLIFNLKKVKQYKKYIYHKI